jgi:hypothetical protein
MTHASLSYFALNLDIGKRKAFRRRQKADAFPIFFDLELKAT